ncbi:hypothetical protein OH77DRAFT_1393090 [Trametes cingulata]|nr:hypothetical protein OH77DRAFT_1393090 [Trametes cingulata]
MLLVHPSSQCDICLDPYTWSTPSKAPHAIQCGHIFCLDCLRSVSPTNCPLCRKGFNPERIKKLHVDKVNGDGLGPAGPMAEENEMFRRMAALFTDDANPEDINALVEEVNSWLAQSNRQSEGSAVSSVSQRDCLVRPAAAYSWTRHNSADTSATSGSHRVAPAQGDDFREGRDEEGLGEATRHSRAPCRSKEQGYRVGDVG